MNILFTYLSAFSVTGGIEKFNKAFMKALFDLSKQEKFELKVLSAYDNKPDERYIPVNLFRGYKGHKLLFSLNLFFCSFKQKIIFIGHINLAPVGWVIKIFNPNVKIVLITHGIEVWKPLTGIKKIFITKCSYILAVSDFTKNKIVELQDIATEKIIIFPNTLDPFFPKIDNFEKPDYLLKRYNLNKNTKVLLTVGRLSSKEQYKGHDKVIEVLPDLLRLQTDIKYIIAGKYDEEEKNRIIELAKRNNVEDKILIVGFVADNELIDHYCLADLFIMLSTGEGFGIVFLEALACGLPVIACKRGGVTDALKDNTNAVLLNCDSKTEILEAIKTKLFLNTKDKISDFNFERFKNNLNGVMELLNG